MFILMARNIWKVSFVGLNFAARDATERIIPENLILLHLLLTFRVPDVFKLLVTCMKPDTHIEVVLNSSQE